MNKTPPKYLLGFFRWFCNPEYVEDIEGDLLERFAKRPAAWRFFLEVLKLLRPSLIKPLSGYQKLNYYGMFKHNIKISLRNARRQRQFTVLNLLGLSMGVATAILIALFINDELTYDTFHAQGDRIYRVNQPDIWGDWNELASTTGPNVATALREEAPEFKEVTRILSPGAQTIKTGPEGSESSVFKEEHFYAAEKNFLDIFSFPLIAGDHRTALNDPNKVILTHETAQRFFGTSMAPADLIGRELDVKAWDGSWQTFSVSAIAKDIPDRSHIQFDLLVSLDSYQEMMDMHGWKWIWTAFSTYGLLHEGVDVANLEARIQSLPAKWAAPTTERIFNQTFEEFTDGNSWTLVLQPLEEIYRSSSPKNNAVGPSGNPLFVQIFAGIGLLVLALSAINFMNLSTARSSTRSKEVGIRKVLGSVRHQLISQFTIESILYVLVSTFLALGIVYLSLDWFNAITLKEMSLTEQMQNPIVIIVLLLFVLALGLVAGCYPAFYLSAFTPIKVLKGRSVQGMKGSSLRNILVVFQFSISITLIICSSFVQKQMSFATSLDLGFQKNNILQIHNIEQFGFETQKVKTSLRSTKGTLGIGKSFGLPPNIWSGDRYKAVNGDEKVIQFSNVRTEEDLLDLLEIEFIAGRNFDSRHETDKYKVIINETAARELGWIDDMSPDQVDLSTKKIALASGDEDAFEVLGIVKDFNFNSIRHEIKPLVIIHHKNDQVWDHGAGRSFYALKLDPAVTTNPDNVVSVLDEIEARLAAIDPSIPFEFSFLDKDFEETFRYERKMGTVLNLFTVMAMIIGCLGLFGLAAFSAEQRTKELGIRKVLGARSSELVVKFSSEFTKLVIVSLAISGPLAWYLMRQWLEGFAYSTPLEWWVFLCAGLTAIVIAFATVGYQAILATSKNPAETLRDE